MTPTTEPENTFVVRQEIDHFLGRHGIRTPSTQIFPLLSDSGRLKRASESPEYHVIRELRSLIKGLDLLSHQKTRIEQAKYRIRRKIQYLSTRYQVHISEENFNDETFQEALKKRAEDDDENAEFDLFGAQSIWDLCADERAELVPLSNQEVHFPEINVTLLKKLESADSQERPSLIPELRSAINIWTETVRQEIDRLGL